jgi:hypothetical protein
LTALIISTQKLYTTVEELWPMGRPDPSPYQHRLHAFRLRPRTSDQFCKAPHKNSSPHHASIPLTNQRSVFHPRNVHKDTRSRNFSSSPAVPLTINLQVKQPMRASLTTKYKKTKKKDELGITIAFSQPTKYSLQDKCRWEAEGNGSGICSIMSNVSPSPAAVARPTSIRQSKSKKHLSTASHGPC